MRATDWDKIASEYFEKIDSPFSKPGVTRKVYALIRNVKRRKEKKVLEIGCGTGTLVPFLAKNFKRVVATDISGKMVEIANEKAAKFDNVTAKKMDSIQIHRLKQKFDVIISVNSMLMPNIVKVNSIIRKCHKLLKRGGVFIGIFPSMDSLVYHALILYDKEYEKRKSRRRAKLATNRILSTRQHDLVFGFFNSEGKQKHYYDFELDYRFRRAGFSKVKIGRLNYPWETIDYDPNPKRYLNGRVYNELWDWTLIAEK